MTFVIDNSVALSWCFTDERSDASMNLLDRVKQSGAFAPSIWPLEALNVLLIAERRNRISKSERQQLTRFLF